ncbi:MAG: hypothetical protein SFW08_10640 [Gemmatimonadaceae bacterium]|nr:hypothetical protein [Gemmatimonadaceae bacterium]
MARAAQSYYRHDSNRDSLVTVAEWDAQRPDSPTAASVDTNADGLISYQEFLRDMRLRSAPRPPDRASAGDVERPDGEESEEPTRKRAGAVDGDDETAPAPSARRRPPTDAPGAPSAPVRRSPPRPMS